MISFKNFRTEINEAFTPKEIKMAIGVASDPRYKGGNYSGAVRAIEKIKKGLANHPQVAAVLKRQNEELNEAFQLNVGDKVAFKFKNKGKMLYGKVTELEKVLGKPGVVVKWSDGTNGRFTMAAFANITGDKQADYVVSERRNKFEPHMMYDPKTGKGYKANTMDDHLRMKELGYTHESK